ncbi:MAG: ORF6N domain-containing protein [Pseudomonadota bacterium]
MEIRGRRVLLDQALAALFGVTTKVFNQAVRRNRARFPEDFVLEDTPLRVANLKVTICDLKIGTWAASEVRATRFGSLWPFDPPYSVSTWCGLYKE